jgi:hypothetical protein
VTIRPTLRKNNLTMVNVKFKYVYNGGFLATVIATSCAPGTKLTRAEIGKLITERVPYNGLDFYVYYHEEVDEDEWAERMEWAWKLIKEYWPTLAEPRHPSVCLVL